LRLLVPTLRVGTRVLDALRPLDGQSLGPGPTTRSVGESIPTQSEGTRSQNLCCLRFITDSTAMGLTPLRSTDAPPSDVFDPLPATAAKSRGRRVALTPEWKRFGQSRLRRRTSLGSGLDGGMLGLLSIHGLGRRIEGDGLARHVNPARRIERARSAARARTGCRLSASAQGSRDGWRRWNGPSRLATDRFVSLSCRGRAAGRGRGGASRGCTAHGAGRRGRSWTRLIRGCRTRRLRGCG